MYKIIQLPEEVPQEKSVNKFVYFALGIIISAAGYSLYDKWKFKSWWWTRIGERRSIRTLYEKDL
jgi:hypothetical protein